MKRFWSMTAALLVCSSAAFAQFTNILDGGSSLLVSNSVDATGTDMWVGDLNPGNSLVISSGGSLTNDNAFIGNSGASGNNRVQILGPDAAWINTGDLFVGNAGRSNSLEIISGTVSSENGFVGATAGASHNTVNVWGAGAHWQNAGTLQIGAASSLSNSVTVFSSGTVSASNLVVFTGNDFNLGNGGMLEMTSDFNLAPQTNLNWFNGGTLSIGGDLTGIDHLDGTNRTLIINGGLWNLAGSDLSIAGTNNVLNISEGGSVMNDSAFLGSSTNDFGNAVAVSNSGSVWSVTGNLVVGIGGSTNNAVSVSDQGRVEVGQNLIINPGNTLNLSTTGLVTVAGNMLVSNAAVSGSGTIEFGAGDNLLNIYGTNSSVEAGVLFDGLGGADAVAFTDNELLISGTLATRFVNFESLNLTNSVLGGSGTLDGFQNINLSGGWIAPDGDLVIDGDFEVADNTTLQITAGMDSLRVMDAGGLNLDNMSAEVTVRYNDDPTAGTNAFLTADGGLSGSFADINIIEHFLLYNFQLTNGTTTISLESEAELDGTISAGPTYAAIQGVRSGFNGMQNAVFARTKQLRRNWVATAHAIPNEAFLLTSPDEPQGPQGPGDNNTIFGMNFWAEQYSGKGDYDRQGPVADFEQFNNGSSMGVDKLIGEALVAGINYTYARTVSSASNGDHVETETYWAGLYGEYVNEQGLYVDALVALARSNYDTERHAVDYRGRAHFRGHDFGGHINVGNYFHHENWAMTPYVGLHYLSINTDSYTETEIAGNEVDIDGTNVDSLESVVGVKLRNRIDTSVGRFQTVGYVEWMYDFLNEEIGTSLSDGTVSVKTSRVTPDETLINTGIGLGWTCTNYMEIGAGYDARFNDHYEEHTGTLMLNIMF